MRKWKPELETPSGRMKTYWLQWKDASWCGTGTSHNVLDWPRLSNREQFKEEDKEAGRGNDGKTTSESGLALNGISYYGKPRTARSGGSWLYNLQWCPNGQRDYRIDELRWVMTGWPHVSLLWLGGKASLIGVFSLIVVSAQSVWVDLSLRYTLQGGGGGGGMGWERNSSVGSVLVCCPVWYSVVGSILLRGEFFRWRGFFPWRWHRFWLNSPKTQLDESVNRGQICAHMHSIGQTQKILTFMS